MTYKESIQSEMTWLTKANRTIFMGENIINAGRIYGTMSDVPLRRCIEMPICENLIAGASIGLALEGYRPIVVFQRMDFMLIAADAIINHMALIPEMSGKKIKLPIIIRCIIGSQDKRFDVGAQHNHDFRTIFQMYINSTEYTTSSYHQAFEFGKPCIIVEWRDKYEDRL